jgi:hypothetical protein
MGVGVSCQVEQLSSAKPAAVYDVLMDIERWPNWMPTVSTTSWEQRGEPDTGVGGVRRVRSGITISRDVVVDGARPHHHSYTASLPRLWPMKDFRGDIRIEEHPNGSLIIWTVTCTSRIRRLERRLQSTVSSTYRRIAAALAEEAERLVR